MRTTTAADPTTRHAVTDHACGRARLHAARIRRMLEAVRGPLENVVADEVFEGRTVAGQLLRESMWDRVTPEALRADELTREETYAAVRGWNGVRS